MHWQDAVRKSKKKLAIRQHGKRCTVTVNEWFAAVTTRPDKTSRPSFPHEYLGFMDWDPVEDENEEG